MVERTGFELAVRFWPSSPSRRSCSLTLFGSNLPIDRSLEQVSHRLKRVSPLKFEFFKSATNHKEDRRFESPSLQQRVTANRGLLL
jgi:hypothetical protein